MAEEAKAMRESAKEALAEERKRAAEDAAASSTKIDANTINNSTKKIF
jgi:hypothetical protein